MKKLLVTGSTGLVGSEAVSFFKEKGWEVIGIDNNSRHRFFDTPDKVPTLDVDIRDEKQVEALFEVSGPFDAIAHAAAQPSHDYSKEHVLEDFHTNATGTLNLLEAARHHSPEATFVYVSTDKVYGSGMRRDAYAETELTWEHDWPFNENTDFEPPFSPFGVSKLAADLYVQEYAAQGWLTTGIFRPGCITGRNHEGAEQHGFLAYLAKCIKEGKPYTIYGYKGKQVRDQIHAHDLVNAFYHFIQNPKSGEIYNIGGGYDRAVSPLSAERLIVEKCEELKFPLPEKDSYQYAFKYRILDEPRFGDRQWDVHDVSKFQKDYPKWKYEYSLDQIIEDVCQK